MSMSEIIALLALVVSIIMMFLSYKQANKKDLKNAADTQSSMTAVQVETSVRLNAISSGIDDIRVDLRAMRNKIDTASEEIAVQKQCNIETQHRLSSLEARFSAAHPVISDNAQN